MIEAQITGQLEHPSIVPLHDLGIDDTGQPFYVMKFIHGRRLSEVIAEFQARKSSIDWSSDLEFRKLLETLVQVCNVVAYAHNKKVLHRDIKPDNVMLGPYGETLVVDWGLAKVIGQPDETCESGVHLSSSGSTATQDGAVVGSPFYMSPEGAEGRPAAVDKSSDVYLLGATLYQILTGQPPRQGSSNWELIDLAIHSRPDRATKTRSARAAHAARGDLPEGDGVSQAGPLPGAAGVRRRYPAISGRSTDVSLPRAVRRSNLTLGEATCGRHFSQGS